MTERSTQSHHQFRSHYSYIQFVRHPLKQPHKMKLKPLLQRQTTPVQTPTPGIKSIKGKTPHPPIYPIRLFHNLPSSPSCSSFTSTLPFPQPLFPSPGNQNFHQPSIHSQSLIHNPQARSLSLAHQNPTSLSSASSATNTTSRIKHDPLLCSILGRLRPRFVRGPKR